MIKAQRWYSVQEIFAEPLGATNHVAASMPLQFDELGIDLRCHWELGDLQSKHDPHDESDTQKTQGRFLIMNAESLPASLALRSIDPYTLRQELLTQHVALIADASPFSLTLTTPGDSFQAQCKLWARIAIDRAEPGGWLHRQRAAKVDLAYRRGIFDRHMRSQADERLSMRPLQEELRAMRDAEWVPEEHWMFGICSGYWLSASDRRWHEDPISGAIDWTSVDIQVRINVEPNLLL